MTNDSIKVLHVHITWKTYYLVSAWGFRFQIKIMIIQDLSEDIVIWRRHTRIPLYVYFV